MKRLIIVCEGPTEQEFCTEVLGVEFAKHDIYVEAPVIKHSHGGIVPWATIKKQILNHLQEGDVYVSIGGLLWHQRPVRVSWMGRI